MSERERPALTAIWNARARRYTLVEPRRGRIVGYAEPTEGRCEGCGETIPVKDMIDPDPTYATEPGHEINRECDACGGSGEVLYGYVTADMASDAGEPGLEGMPQDGPCPRCGGGGIQRELCGPIRLGPEVSQGENKAGK